jgi:hypothetical protein
MRAALVSSLLVLLGAHPVFADAFRTLPPTTRASCDCNAFRASLEEAEKIYESRNEHIEMPLTPVMHDNYRARVDAAYARAVCLAGCANVPETDRNRARMLIAESGFKEASLGAGEWKARLQVVYEAMARCLAVDPQHRGCMMWHAGSRGILARGSWNPLNITLPLSLMAEFKAARGNDKPGCDHDDGSATRGEASMLLKVPRYAGGNPAAGRELIETAAKSAPKFGCRLANRLVVAEALGRTGDNLGAARELRAIIAGGLPACSPERYENALSLQEAERCLARIEALPDEDPGWDTDCRREVRE